MVKFFLGALLLVTASAQAAPGRELLKVPANFATLPQSCYPVDYSQYVGPIRNQGETAWCFAYTAADLISQRVGGFVSAVDLATQFYLADERELAAVTHPAVREFLASYPSFAADLQWARAIAVANKPFRRFPGVSHAEGGFEDLAAIVANARGLCAEANLPSNNGYSLQALKRLRHYVYTNLANQRMNRSEAVARANREWMQSVDRVCKRVESPVPFIPVSVFLAPGVEEFRTYQRQGRLYPQDAGRRLLGLVNYALNNGRIAAIGYDADLISDFGNDDELQAHASSIVGRNMINGQCHYLLRNSWGASCDYYRPEFRDRCRAGHLWISEAELIKASFSASFLR